MLAKTKWMTVTEPYCSADVDPGILSSVVSLYCDVGVAVAAGGLSVLVGVTVGGGVCMGNNGV